MKLRIPLATMVREVSSATDIPVDVVLEEAILQWVEHHAAARFSETESTAIMGYHALLTLTRHEGVDRY